MRRPEVENDELEVAAASFRHFFSEVRSRFPERDEVIERLELALLSREHLLLTGPPGSGKSALVAAVLGAVQDAAGAPSLYARQLTETTVQSDLVGPVDFKVLTETGRTVHLLDEGMLGARFAFLDEVFDGRDMLLRSILNVLYERELKHGAATSSGLLQCAVLTSNRSLTEVLERAPELMVAFADRIAFSAYVPQAFASPGNRSRMLSQALEGQRPALTSILPLEHLSRLQREVAQVGVSEAVREGLMALTDALAARLHEAAARHEGYRPSRIFSQRALVKAQDILRAAVVRERIWRTPGRVAEARLEDLRALRATYTLGGPTPEALKALEAGALEPGEQAQLRFIELEREAFEQALEEGLTTARRAADIEAQQLGLPALRAAREVLPQELDSALCLSALERLRGALIPGPRHPGNRQVVLEEASALFDALGDRLARERVSGWGAAEPVLDVVEAAVALLGADPPGLTVEDVWLRQLGAQLELAGGLLLGELEDAVMGAAGQPLASLEQRVLDTARRLERLERVGFALRRCAQGMAPDGAALARLRMEAGRRLRRCIETSFAAEGAGPDALASRVEVLERLETALSAVAPVPENLREGLLEPLVRAWSLRAVSAEAGWVSELTARLRETLRLCRRHGIATERTFQELGPMLRERLASHVEALRARQVAVGVPALSEALTSRAYDAYREQLSTTGLEQEGEALGALESVLMSGGAPSPVTPALRDEVREVSLQALEARVGFLQRWFDVIDARLPAPGSPVRPADAARWLTRLIDSRLPLLTLREGELRRLRHALEHLPAPSGAEARIGRSIERLEALARDIEGLGHQLLEQRS